MESDESGRPGEPWVLVDHKSRTVLPLSGRGWKGTHKPGDVGVTPWLMCLYFGRHMPGGDYGEKFTDASDGADWLDASGAFEINCLACHNADFRQDQSEAALQAEYLTETEIKQMSHILPALKTASLKEQIPRNAFFTFVTVDTLMKMVSLKLQTQPG